MTGISCLINLPQAANCRIRSFFDARKCNQTLPSARLALERVQNGMRSVGRLFTRQAWPTQSAKNVVGLESRMRSGGHKTLRPKTLPKGHPLRYSPLSLKSA